MREITAYICEHCEKKIYRHKSSAHGHESRCYWNPANRACASCDNQILGQITISDGHVRDTAQCVVTGANLLIKSELRRYCESWIGKPNF